MRSFVHTVYSASILFLALLKYLASFSMPMTFEAPWSRPAINIVPDPEKGSSKAPPVGKMYRHHQAATSYGVTAG